MNNSFSDEKFNSIQKIGTEPSPGTQSPDEPQIAINGITLNNAQVMTLRCAITEFGYGLRTHGLKDDGTGTGKALTSAYLTIISEIEALCLLHTQS